MSWRAPTVGGALSMAGFYGEGALIERKVGKHMDGVVKVVEACKKMDWTVG